MQKLLQRVGFARAVRIAGVVDSGACRFQVGNVVDLPFPDRSFDAAISFRLLTHCEAWPVLIRELCRVARRTVIVDYPTSQSVRFHLGLCLLWLRLRWSCAERPWRSP